MPEQLLDPLIEFTKWDLYELLGVEANAEEQSIRKAYRKVALKYHPDKNATQEAVDKFHLLSLTLDTLTSGDLREEYDRLRNSRLEKERRTAALGAERRKLQDDLEARERKAFAASQAQNKRKLEILKMEGIRKRQMFQGQQDSMTKPQSTTKEEQSPAPERTILIKCKRNDIGMSDTAIENILGRFGIVEHLLIKKKDKKACTIVVVFKETRGAETCAEFDFSTSSLSFFKEIKQLDWLKSKATTGNKTEEEPIKEVPQPTSLEDYKNITLLRLRNAEKINSTS